jgi:uncharacterized protein (UPF0332 family)
MTDRQVLLAYRIKQAEETLLDAEKMFASGISSRSVVNRLYYALFYAVLALFIHANVDIRTSKHAGVIAVFDSEFVHTGKIDRQFSKILHRIFDARLECDYREFASVAPDDAAHYLRLAGEFLTAVKNAIAAGSNE